MKLHPSLTFPVIILAASAATALGDSTISPSSYPDLFQDPATADATPTLGFLQAIAVGGSVDKDIGKYWHAKADGGLAIGVGGVVSVVTTGAEVALTGDSLQFNLSNDPNSVLGLLHTNVSVALDWAATATFNKTGAVMTLSPNTTYNINFDVDTGSGLLNSALGIAPTFGVSLLDSDNKVIGTSTGGTVANVIGLQLGTIVGSPSLGRATIQFKTGASVGTGAAKLKFTGAALLPATLTSIGAHFATVSNINVAPDETPYEHFIRNSDVTDPDQQAQDADPDHDGRTNIAEFAVDSDPATGGSGNIYSAVGDPDGSGPETSTFVLTLPVRDGAVFSPDGNGADVATQDGVTYQVEGSFDLVNWTLAVSEVTANSPFTAGLPTLGSGWTYRSFRVPGQTTDTPHAFLRVKFF